MPFLRFAKARNAGVVDLPDNDPVFAHPEGLLKQAKLDWCVDSRDVLVSGSRWLAPVKVKGYQALIRPDTSQPMSVVTTAYRVAENDWVLNAALSLARSHDAQAVPVCASASGATASGACSA